MKLPSLKNLFTQTKTTFLRFPLSILAAVVGTAISIYLFENEKEIDNAFPYINLLLTAALGIPLFFCVSVYNSFEKTASLKRKLFYGLALLLLIAIYFSLPNSEFNNNTRIPYIRYSIYNIIIHLLVSFVPYWKTTKLNGFWNYNKMLFIRVWTAILYSGFLYLGLVMALFAVDKLFTIDLHEKLYFDIYIFIAGVFNTWFFLGGIPTDLNSLEEQKTYPKGLKVFTQFILLPLLILYLAILYVYGIKIIANWDWPKGIVSYLISGVSILGILAILLIYPFSNSKENSWIKQFSKIYYYILVPLVALLFLAIFMRINQYGITINRYIIVLLGIWLSIICVYFSVGKSNIKFIPTSLALLLALSSFGPWGMFSVSEKHQSKRLLNLLETYKITTNGKVTNEVLWITDSLPKLHAKKLKINQHLISDSIHNEIYSIVDYLNDNHGYKSMAPIFHQNIDSLIRIAKTGERHVNEKTMYMKSLGLQSRRIYKNNWNSKEDFRFSTRNLDFTDISEYAILINNRYYNKNSDTKRYYVQGFTYCTDRIDPFEKILTLHTKEETIDFDLKPLSTSLIEQFGEKTNIQLNKKRLTLYKNAATVNVKLEINNMRFEKEKDSLFLTAFNTKIFIKEK